MQIERGIFLALMLPTTVLLQPPAKGGDHNDLG